MDEKHVSRKVCAEQCKRFEDEDARQNHCIDKLKQTIEKIHELATATEKTADNKSKMIEEQMLQGNDNQRSRAATVKSCARSPRSLER